MSCLRSPLWWAAVAAALPVWGMLAMRLPPRPAWPGTAWVMAVLLYPVLEEIVFRQGLQGGLLRRSWGRRGLPGLPHASISVANLLAATVFAVFHLYAHTPLWAAAVLVPGLVFGLCYERWGVGAAIILHAWYNAGYFTLYPPGA